MTDDDKAFVFLGSLLVLGSSAVYFSSIRPAERAVRRMEDATACTPKQAAAAYERRRQQHGQWLRDTGDYIVSTLDHVGLGVLGPSVEKLSCWLSAPPPEADPRSIQPVAITGTAASVAPNGGAAGTQARVTPTDPNLNGLIESALPSSPLPAGSLKSLNGSQLLLRVREASICVETPPLLTPLALFAFNQSSSMPIWGSRLNAVTRLEQGISRTVTEEPWGITDTSGGSTLPVQPGCLHGQRNTTVSGSLKGLSAAGQVRYQAESTWRNWPWLGMLLASKHYLRIRDTGIPAGATITFVGGMHRDATGALVLCAHPDFGFCVPESLQALIDRSRASLTLERALLATLAGCGALLVTVGLWEQRHYLRRVWQWATFRREVFPRWGDARCHRPVRGQQDALTLLRTALQRQGEGADLDTVELEPGVFLRAELARAAGPGVTALEELNVADDQPVGDDDDEALRCSVCLQRRRCIMCLPCRHVATCIECMVVHTLNRRGNAPDRRARCPICMADLEWIQRVYL